MQKHFLPNLTLTALAASYFVQIGAGVFALSMIGSRLSAAPPRSLAMLQGPYGYDSSMFWQIAPSVTGALFLCATVANWRTRRRSLVLGAFALFVLSGVLSVMALEPRYMQFIASGYRDSVDPALQRQAASWYVMDWGLRGVDAIAGLTLLVALSRPVADRA